MCRAVGFPDPQMETYALVTYHIQLDVQEPGKEQCKDIKAVCFLMTYSKYDFLQ